MEEQRNQEMVELKHVCRLCNKRYPSGKSLGGHMRSHVIANAQQKSKAQAKKVANFEKDPLLAELCGRSGSAGGGGGGSSGGGVGASSGYGLRENPKKTWRMVDSSLPLKQERVCKQCGKGFQSLKALCGHMSSHSERNLSTFKEVEEEEEEEEDEDEKSWSSESKDFALAMESHSDNVVDEELKRETRSRSATKARYKALTSVESLSFANGSSSNNHSEIEQDQEEVAMCLMMLSRDSSGKHKKDFNSNNGINLTAESSDNNSVILEGGSSNTYVGLAAKRRDPNHSVYCDGDETLNSMMQQSAASKKMKFELQMDNSDSGYFENGAKELESDDSVDGFCRNYRFNKPKPDFASRLDSPDTEFIKNYGFKKPLIHVYQLKSDHDSRKRNRSDSNSPESADQNHSLKKIKQGYLNDSDAQKDTKFECFICKKRFRTHQALGGHVISHRKMTDNTSNAPKPEHSGVKSSTAKNIMANNSNKGSGSKKIKGHKCPFCPKVFTSGQALGGHKRSHLIGGGLAEIKAKMGPKPVEQKPLLDLNLPAPTEEEGSGNS